MSPVTSPVPRRSTVRPLPLRGAAVGTLLAAGLVLTGAGTASAHVTVDPSEVPGGGYRTVNIKVPNERDDASTVEVELYLDTDHPVASVMPQPVPGWDIEIETTELDEPLEMHGRQITEVPSRIVWSGGEINPGMFQQFPVSMGRLPSDVDRLVLNAIQTYDSGEVVRWIDEPTDDAEHPAATLTLTPAADDHDHSHGDDADADEAADTDTDTEQTAAGDDGDDAHGSAAESGTSDTTARVLGVVGILVGAAGVAFGVLAGRRRPSGS
ncbi:YcnI family protein [Streptomyces sp. ST2-7A]|uniref:YcnI family copper-binding membrane protein n=1 Tax=Streptomyces sp. ST2-7A TaxID=2907214 RepID=UPI001F473FCF|nr:YcnI family protein [Streptomyces sp. ST2-7A]MCE7083392.1 YcnI family protein [Streptomyces sp. ST2-7A]